MAWLVGIPTGSRASSELPKRSQSVEKDPLPRIRTVSTVPTSSDQPGVRTDEQFTSRGIRPCSSHVSNTSSESHDWFDLY